MRKILNCLIVATIVALSCQCGKDASRQQADNMLSDIRTLIDQRRLNLAKIEIDSLHRLYPKLIEQRKEAQRLQDTITLLEAERTQVFVDSMLQILHPQTDSLLKLFRYEPATVYESCGKFVHPALTTLRNTDRCFLKAQVSEDRSLLVSSYYTGRRINHTGISLHAGDNTVQAQGHNHSFDAEQHHEITSLDTDNGVMLLQFVSANRQQRIRVDLQAGSDTKYKYYLQDSEKQALEQTLELYVRMQDIQKLELMNRQANELIRLKTKQK